MPSVYVSMECNLELGLSFAQLALLIAVCLGTYLNLVRHLRYKRLQAIHRNYGFNSECSKQTISLTGAYEIAIALATLEFPTTFTSGVRLGMFKYYAIPTISNLLMQTGHFDDVESASRRAADTGALFTETFFHPPGSPRGINAIARTNFLHSGYRKNGRISNDDMLYTWTLSILEPIRLINRYEWRSLSPLEINALATYWKSLGEAFNISYLNLASTTWPDGQEWLHELDEWARAYEESNLQWSQANVTVAGHAAGTLGAIQRHTANTLLEPQRRQAIGFTPPPYLYRNCLELVLTARRLFIRHLCLPRYRPIEMTGIPSTKPGHYWARSWSSRPWYTKASRWARFGLSAWLARLLNQPCPGDKKYCPEGYDPKQIGPFALRGKGHDFIQQEKARLSGLSGARCPFTGRRESLCPFGV